MPRVFQVATCVLALIELDDAISVVADGGSKTEGQKTSWNIWNTKKYFTEFHPSSKQYCHTCPYGKCAKDAPDRPIQYLSDSDGLRDCQFQCLQDPNCNYLSMWDGHFMQCVFTLECNSFDTEKGVSGNVVIWKKTAEAGGASAEVPAPAPAPLPVALAKVRPQAEMQSEMQPREKRESGEQHREERESKRESRRAKASKATAFFVSSDGQRCLEGEEKYIEKKVKELEVSFLAKEFADAVSTLGSCVENGFTSGPHESPCFKKAEQYTKTGPLDDGFWGGEDGGATSYALRSRKHICH